MSLGTHDRSMIDYGTAALQRGDTTEAFTAFNRAAEEGKRPPWLLLAAACRRAGERKGEEAALERELAIEKRNMFALLAMGELKAHAKDSRAAGAFFRAALSQAAATNDVPVQIQPLLQRAQAYLEEARELYTERLLAQIESAGLMKSSVGGRVGHAIDLLLGRTPVYLQQPTTFYFPGLPQRAFYEREEFGWLAGLETAAPKMQTELEALLPEPDAFSPYIASQSGRPRSSSPLADDPRWSALYLWENGTCVPDVAERCPATIDALARAPMPVIRGRSPMALFSLLAPGAHIPPHHGHLNTRLICHIPLITNEQCALRVGPETRGWEAGKALIFDDSFEHEAWNRGDQDRIILLFEIWRPELTGEERAALTTLFESVDLLFNTDEQT